MTEIINIVGLCYLLASMPYQISLFSTASHIGSNLRILLRASAISRFIWAKSYYADTQLHNGWAENHDGRKNNVDKCSSICPGRKLPKWAKYIMADHRYWFYIMETLWATGDSMIFSKLHLYGANSRNHRGDTSQGQFHESSDFSIYISIKPEIVIEIEHSALYATVICSSSNKVLSNDWWACLLRH